MTLSHVLEITHFALHMAENSFSIVCVKGIFQKILYEGYVRVHDDQVLKLLSMA